MKKSYKISKGNKKRESHFIIELELIFVLFLEGNPSKEPTNIFTFRNQKIKRKKYFNIFVGSNPSKINFRCFLPLHACLTRALSALTCQSARVLAFIL